jgi:hypothetical protein
MGKEKLFGSFLKEIQKGLKLLSFLLVFEAISSCNNIPLDKYILSVCTHPIWINLIKSYCGFNRNTSRSSLTEWQDSCFAHARWRAQSSSGADVIGIRINIGFTIIFSRATLSKRQET